jgi:hypothetical protein
MGEDQMPQTAHHADTTSQDHATNLCGYDGFLHATICSNANNNNLHFTTTNPVQFVSTPNRFIHHHSKKSRVKAHEAARLTTAAARHNSTTPLKSVLNPANLQALTVEQKMNRSLNHVEKWLERDHSQPSSKNLKTDDLKLHEASARLRTNNENLKNKPKLQRSKSKEEIMSRDKSCLINPDIFLEKLKITENLVESTVTPKKVAAKDPVTASTKKPTSAKVPLKTTAEKGVKNVVLEYSTIPVSADPAECENLLRVTSDDDTLNNELSNDSTVHQYVHIHHHYHHFENDEC